ncbi:MAG: serine/threonine-protein phosphatase [Acidobacteriota bacterium]|nr:serine/threonine-protein phosphatase [Acidobacteriota bacterium]
MSARPRKTKRPRRYVTRAQSFVRDYTEGLNVRDVKRLFERDAQKAYAVLARDQSTGHPDDGKKVPLGTKIKIVLGGISSRLSPARRLLFALAICSFLLALLGTVHLDISFLAPLSFLLKAPTLWFLLCIAALFFLLTMELVDRVRVRDELEVARQLQNDLLPQSSPVVAGYSFAHSYRTANEVGGDYHDFTLLPDGRLGLTVGDASGHGIAAGLLMAIANATLKTAIEIDPTPHQVASLLNTTLCRTGDRRAFMTLFYGVLEPQSGELEYVGAGHPFPLLRRAGGKVIEIGEGSLPLGMRTKARLPGGQVRLGKGDLLVLYTDGLPEATDPEGRRAFGFDRLERLLSEPGTPAEIHKRILSEFDRHVGASALNDDFTLVVVAREMREMR